VLNEIWELDWPFTNLVCTQQNLISRERVGAKVIKRHDAARTPHQRALDADALSPAKKAALTRTLNKLRPGQVQRQIDTRAAQLERLALSKTTAAPRPINRAFNKRPSRPCGQTIPTCGNEVHLHGVIDPAAAPVGMMAPTRRP